MASICCKSQNGASEKTSDGSEARPCAARRRRMQLRRISPVPNHQGMITGFEPTHRRQDHLGTDVVEQSPAEETKPSAKPNPHASAEESSESEPTPRYGRTSVRGRRTQMEDAVSICPDFFRRSHTRGRHHLYGVFDGHGCSHVADSCRDQLHEIVADELERLGSAPADWEGVMGRSFSRMDARIGNWGSSRGAAKCRCELRTPSSDFVGSAAVVAVVTADQIVVANCGDSRAVLSRGGAAVRLSTDHKPDRPDEMERIEAAGGRVIFWNGARVLGVLAMSRAIGDGYLKPYVISQPELTITERKDDDECLIIASDGLWDVITNETACEIARMCLRANRAQKKDSKAVGSERNPGGNDERGRSDRACYHAAKFLTKLALARQSTDNVSVIVVDLKRPL